MFAVKELLAVLALTGLAFSLPADTEPEVSSPEVEETTIPDPVCVQIKAAISSASDVYYLGTQPFSPRVFEVGTY